MSNDGWQFVATGGTHEMLVNNGVQSKFVFKISDLIEPNIQRTISKREVGLIINLPKDVFSSDADSDGFKIRRLAIDFHIPLVTNFQLSEALLESLALFHGKPFKVESYRELVRNGG